jgi:hypothetical protein
LNKSVRQNRWQTETKPEDRQKKSPEKSGLSKQNSSGNQLDNSHWSGIAPANIRPDDARVAAIAPVELRSDLIEQFFDGFFIIKDGSRLTSGINILFLAESNQLLCDRTKSFGFGNRSLDAAVHNQTDGQIRKESFPVRGRSAEFDRFLPVSHNRCLSCCCYPPGTLSGFPPFFLEHYLHLFFLLRL